MAKVLGLHELELYPNVQQEEFERYFRDAFAPAPWYPGWRINFLRADRGAKVGTYLFLFEIDSEEA